MNNELSIGGYTKTLVGGEFASHYTFPLASGCLTSMRLATLRDSAVALTLTIYPEDCDRAARATFAAPLVGIPDTPYTLRLRGRDVVLSVLGDHLMDDLHSFDVLDAAGEVVGTFDMTTRGATP